MNRLSSNKRIDDHYIYNPLNNMLFRLNGGADSSTSIHNKNSQSQFMEHEYKTSMKECKILNTKYPFPIHSFTNSNEIHRANKTYKVVFCLTNQCNFRCSYCVYGGQYKNLGYRGHSSESMSFDVIKMTIDYIESKKAQNINEIAIIFYGGEPTLEMDLIKATVDYVKQKRRLSHYIFSVSTNGSLLSNDIVDFFIKHEFNVLISVDGGPDTHNKNRVYSNNEATFNDVFNNLKSIKSKNTKFYEDKVGFNVTFDESDDLENSINFFSRNTDLFPINKMHFSHQKSSTGPEELIKINEYLTEIVFGAIEKLVGNSSYTPFNGIVEEYQFLIGEKFLFQELSYLFNTLNVNRTKNGTIAHWGCCNIGEDVLFIDVYGDFFPCQEAAFKEYCIGNASQGIEIDRVNQLRNKFYYAHFEICKYCWAFQLCSRCYAYYNIYGTSDDKVLSSCNNYRYLMYINLSLVCEILNRDRYFFQRHNRKFH